MRKTLPFFSFMSHSGQLENHFSTVLIKKHVLVFADNSDNELNINMFMSSICGFEILLHAVIIYVPYINHNCLGKRDTSGRAGMW